MRRLLQLLPLLLAGCISAPQLPQPLVRPPGEAAFELNGRIAIKHDGERSSANVRWIYRAADDDILLLAPFG